jgi:hypothetical protein
MALLPRCESCRDAATSWAPPYLPMSLHPAAPAQQAIKRRMPGKEGRWTQIMREISREDAMLAM